MTRQDEAFRKGWESGSYDEAYSGKRCIISWRRYKSKLRSKVLLPHHEAGYYLGFYSSYEIHEVPEEDRDVVEYLREACVAQCKRTSISCD